MPTLLPEGLGPQEHLRVALGLQRPVARPVVLKPHIHHALDNQHTGPSQLNSLRYIINCIVLQLGELLKGATQRILSLVYRDLLPLFSKKILAFVRELNFIVQCPD